MGEFFTGYGRVRLIVKRRPFKLIVFGLGLLAVLWILPELGSPIRVYEGKGYSRITFDRRERPLDVQIAPDGRYRSPVKLSAIPEDCIDAAMFFEDQYFYRHPGVNPFSMIRAFLSTFGEKRVGGSTLTMQLVRLRTGVNTKGVQGKLRQMWDALVLERSLSKREILEGYFTFAPYGGGIEGIAAASAIYFAKTPDKLTRAECAGLAVLPQSPASRSGFRGPDFQKAYERLAGKLGIPHNERSINFPDRDSLSPPHYARHLTHRVLSAGGVALTTVDRDTQEDLERVVDGYVNGQSGLGLKNASVLVADGASGEILAYVGSRDYADFEIQGFVDGVFGKRSPGSLLKPFVYGKAIDEGVIIPDSILADIPIKLASYEPENFEQNFLGLIPAREALVKSRNIPALLLNSQLQGDGLYTLLSRGGVSLSRSADFYGSAVVLGGIEITLFDAVRLYTALVSRGEAVPLHAVRLSGESPRAEATRLFSAESAYLTRDMLRSNPAPNGFGLKNVAWKTGTSSGGRDAWAVGVLGNIVVGVWLGNFDGTPNANFIGRDLAGPLLFLALQRLWESPATRLPIRTDTSGSRLNLKHVELCPESGMLRSDRCPHAKQALMIPGVSPIRTCNVHRETEHDPPIYPSEVTAHLVNAGLKLGVAAERRSDFEKIPPRIISPEEGVEYRVQFGMEPEIEFRANVDGEARKLFWYIDGTLLGETDPSRSFFWRARPGSFVVRAVDSLGASDAVRIRVQAQEN